MSATQTFKTTICANLVIWRETGVKHCNLVEQCSMNIVQYYKENEIESEKADALLMARDWSEKGTLSGVVFFALESESEKAQKEL